MSTQTYSRAVLVTLLVIVAGLVIEAAYSNSYYQTPYFSIAPKPVDSSNPCAACGTGTCALALQSKPNVYIGCVGGIRVIHKCQPGELLNVQSFKCEKVAKIEKVKGKDKDKGEEVVVEEVVEEEEEDEGCAKPKGKLLLLKLHAIQSKLDAHDKKVSEELKQLNKAVHENRKHCCNKETVEVVEKPVTVVEPVVVQEQPVEVVKPVGKIDGDAPPAPPAPSAPSAPSAPPAPVIETPTSGTADAIDDEFGSLDLDDPRRKQQLRQMQTLLNLFGMGGSPTEEEGNESSSDDSASSPPQREEMRRRLMKMLWQ